MKINENYEDKQYDLFIRYDLQPEELKSIVDKYE